MERRIFLSLLLILSGMLSASADSLYCSGQNGGAGTGLSDNNGNSGASPLVEVTALRSKEILKMARSLRQDATINPSAHNLVLLANGDLYGFGYNVEGAVGAGNATTLVSTPIKLNFSISVAEIEIGWYTSYIIATNGTLFSWGKNSDGQLGCDINQTPLGNTSYYPAPVVMTNLPVGATWTRVSCRFYHCLGLSGGSLYGWGRNVESQIGTGDSSSVYIPTAVYSGVGSGLEGKTILDFSAGMTHSAAIKTDGKLLTWGYSALGAHCHGMTTASALTDPIPTLRTAGVLATNVPTRVKAGGDFTIMFFDDAKDFAGCGDNSHAPLGIWPWESSRDIPKFSGGTRDAGWWFTGEFDIGYQYVSTVGTDGINLRAYNWGSNSNCNWGWELAASVAANVNDAGFILYGTRYSYPALQSPQSGEDWAGQVGGRCGHCRWRQTIPSITAPATLPFINASIGANITFNMNALQGDGSARIARPKIVMENGAECSNLVKVVGTVWTCTLTKVPTQPGAARLRAVLPSGVSSQFVQVGNWSAGVPLNIQPTYVASVADIPTTLFIPGGSLNRTALNSTITSVDIVGLGPCVAPNLTLTGDGIQCNLTTKPSSLGPITATITYSDGYFIGPTTVANFQLPPAAPTASAAAPSNPPATTVPPPVSAAPSGSVAPQDSINAPSGGILAPQEQPIATPSETLAPQQSTSGAIPPQDSNNANAGGSSNIAGIAGGIIGAVVGIAIVIVIIVILLKRRKNGDKDTTNQEEMKKPEPASPAPVPAPVAEEPPKKKKSKAESADSVPTTAPETSYTTLEEVATSSPAASRPAKSRKRSASKKKPRRQVTTTTLAERDWKIKYEDLKLEKELGSGAYGVVWRGTWVSSKVAIKQSILGSASSKAIDEMNREAELMCNLRPHANVLQIYGVCQHEKTVMLVSEFCSKGSLDSYFGKGVLKMRDKVAIIKGVAAGILHLHNNRIVHRDLAARNVLLSSSMQPKVSDFGMSRLLGEKEEAKNTASTVGPVRWMSPESLSSLQYSYASDVWSFGVTCWEIISEKTPHEGMQMLDVAVKVRDEGLTPSPWPEDTPQPLIEMCNTLCWRKNPDQRASMKNVVEFLSEKFPDDESEEASVEENDDDAK